MQIKRLILHDFTVFGEATFELSPGVNVLIGENGTGKSHLLKLIYALTEAVRRSAAGESLEDGMVTDLEQLVRGMLLGVFQPDGLSSFLLHKPGRATIAIEWEAARLAVTLDSDGDLTAIVDGDASTVGRPLFIPPREVLSIYPGFAAAWLHRESAFDRTYFDLCVALGLGLLRTGGPAALVEPIERELGGKVVMKEGRFYVEYPGGDMEVAMVAEGDRKLAMIAYLLKNGSLSDNAILLWDEPEANLNPKRARLTFETASGLAHAGVQVFLATHDYALTSELSLGADTGVLGAGEVAFFGLSRPPGGPGVVVERGQRLAEIQDNPILDALASLHAREREAFASDAGGR